MSETREKSSAVVGEEGRDLVVMYHYVRPDGAEVPAGIRPLWAGEFERQLDWLAERYDVVGAGEFLDRMGRDGGRPVCLLTFDDGTKDHAEVVTPILRRRGLSGVFFVLAGPARDGLFPLTHAVHWLLSGDEGRVWEAFERYAVDHLGGVGALGDEGEARRIYHYETPLRGRIKYAANMALPAEATEAVVSVASAEAGRSTVELAREWFVSDEDIRAMVVAGMTVAMHGCSHRSLQALGGEGMAREIGECSDYLAGLIGRRPEWFACPFGGSGASAETIAVMQAALVKAGVVAAVSTEKTRVGRGCDRMRLPRFDAIDLPPRKVL